MTSDMRRAAAVGDVETVSKWLTARGYTHIGQLAAVVDQAVRHGLENICQLLLDCDAIRNNEAVINQTLIDACQLNRMSIAKRVIQHCSIDKHTLIEALICASLSGNVHIVEWLISDVMHLSYTDRIRWKFINVCVGGDVSDVQQLAARVHSDVTSVMSQALRLACLSGSHDVVKWLTLHTTADVSTAVVTRFGYGEMSPLMEACDTYHKRVAIQLLQCVTPHTVSMMSGRRRDTALHLTCFSETDIRLHTACSEGDVDAMSNLVYTSKCDVNLQDSSGLTALHIACMYGGVEETQLLLSLCARIDIADINRRTPAMLAQEFSFTMLEPYLCCTLTESRDNNSTSTRVTDNNTDTVSISLSSIADTQQNKNKSHKSNQVIKSTNKRIV